MEGIPIEGVAEESKWVNKWRRPAFHRVQREFGKKNANRVVHGT
jgi:hypothetical protein